jgi:predicted RNase H-like HicB family nuclease
MKDTARYVKIVEWSEEDQCYVGSAPGLVLGGCHGADEKDVFAELCDIVDEAIALYQADGKILPPATSGQDLANSIQSVA